MFKSFLKVAISLMLGGYSLQTLPLLASENILPNGVFLYGQSLQPNEIGQEYLVFEVQQNQIRGAIYLPDSEFSCFEGTLTPQAMNLSITDAYSQTVHPFQISLQQQVITASVAITGTIMELEGYHKLNRLSDRDHHILNTCLSQ